MDQQEVANANATLFGKLPQNARERHERKSESHKVSALIGGHIARLAQQERFQFCGNHNISYAEVIEIDKETFQIGLLNGTARDIYLFQENPRR